MENKPTYYVDLMSRYFCGEATPEERVLLRKWLGADAANQQQFDALNATWQHLERAKIEKNVDVDGEWATFKLRIAARAEQETPIVKLYSEQKPPQRLYMRFLKYAAVLVWIGLSTFLVYRYIHRSQELTLTAAKQNLQTLLADGSDVTLGANSTMVYPDKFNGDTRRIKLSGEAYFNVKHDASHAFVVMAGDVRVEVLGTSFYVNTQAANGNVEVVLTSGKVAVYYKDKPEARTILEPGQKAVVSLADKKIRKEVNEDENYLAWKTRKLVFTDEKLQEVVPTLNKVYGSDILLATNSIADCRITATFDKQSLDAVLNVLQATLDLTIVKKGNSIAVSGSGCK
ncbi:MAG: FecR domain-containing protein [Bacteroidota bacterium]